MKKKRILKIICIATLVFILLNMIAVPIVYGIIFAKPHSYNPDTTLGVYNYQEYEKDYPREEVIYQGQKNKLTGYAYMTNTTDYLVVTVHGIKDNADCLLMEDLFFINQGYNVFSFDMSGCGKSEGKVNGFTQGLIDLDYTLTYLNTDNRFKDTKKLLFGFSAGGYAVASVLAKNKENVYGVASISGYNDGKNLIADKGFGYAGPLVYLGRPIVSIMEHVMFKDYLDIKATDGIDSTDVPVFLAHGTKDHTINYKFSIVAKYEDSSSVFTYTEEAGHSSLLYSKEAREYQKQMKGKDKSEVDSLKYSELNKTLFDKIIDFYATCKK